MHAIVSVCLFLILASTNASNYFHPLSPYQQEPLDTSYISGEFAYQQPGYNNDDYQLFSPKLAPDSTSGGEWSTGTDSRSNRILQQYLGNGSTLTNETKFKRTEASLSIVNALDVLRQRLILEFARRRMNESKAQIEKNRVLLSKTGKRSQKNNQNNLGEFLLRRRIQTHQFLDKPLPETFDKENEDMETLIRKNTDVDPGFQT